MPRNLGLRNKSRSRETNDGRYRKKYHEALLEYASIRDRNDTLIDFLRNQADNEPDKIARDKINAEIESLINEIRDAKIAVDKLAPKE